MNLEIKEKPKRHRRTKAEMIAYREALALNPPEEKPKRHRRTKAEMEAYRASLLSNINDINTKESIENKRTEDIFNNTENNIQKPKRHRRTKKEMEEYRASLKKKADEASLEDKQISLFNYEKENILNNQNNNINESIDNTNKHIVSDKNTDISSKHKIKSTECIIEKIKADYEKTKQDEDGFVFCSNRKCPHYECFRHNSQIPMSRLVWVEDFTKLHNDKKNKNKPITGNDDCSYYL